MLFLSFYVRTYQSRYSNKHLCTVVSIGFLQCAQCLCVHIIWGAHELERFGFGRMRVEDQKLKYNLEWS